jgi:uncharacterized protein (UPF0335 family)
MAEAGNGFDHAVVEEMVGKLEGCDADLISEHSSYMNACRQIRQRKKDLYALAKEQGLPQLELKTLVRTRKKDREKLALIEALEQDQRQVFEMLREALGDFGETPLGASALERAAPQGEMLDSLTQ